MGEIEADTQEEELNEVVRVGENVAAVVAEEDGWMGESAKEGERDEDKVIKMEALEKVEGSNEIFGVKEGEEEEEKL